MVKQIDQISFNATSRWPSIEIKSAFYVLHMKICFYLFLQNDEVCAVTKDKAKSYYKV